MVVATVFALAAAVLHTGWNLIAKRSDDAFLALWGQFLAAGLVAGAALAVSGGPPAAGWGWATLTGLIHLPYLLGLSWAYDHGDFSLAYPVARGGGALLASVGGVALLDDRLSSPAVVAIALVVGGMMLLSAGAPFRQVAAALVVAAAIGSYTTVDSHASRQFGGVSYVFAVFVMVAAAVSVWGVAAGRHRELLTIGRLAWARIALAAVMSIVTYGLVLLAVRRAPVGYVAALRESSVLLAALIGWRFLGEGRGAVRGAAAAAIVFGLVLLVAAG